MEDIRNNKMKENEELKLERDNATTMSTAIGRCDSADFYYSCLKGQEEQ